MDHSKLPSLKAHLKYYRSQHQTLGCKITHLIGIPMIAFSLPIFLLDRRRGLALFGLGWLLQFIGHYVFEKNKPIVFSSRRSPYTIMAALVFVTEEWMDTFKSVHLELHENGYGNGNGNGNGNNGNGRRHLLREHDDVEAV